jgi:hypothetical protein
MRVHLLTFIYLLECIVNLYNSFSLMCQVFLFEDVKGKRPTKIGAAYFDFDSKSTLFNDVNSFLYVCFVA